MKENIKNNLLQSCHGLTINHNCWSESKINSVLYPMPNPIGVTIHNAGTPSNPSAKNLTAAMKNNPETCWHFSVDENEAWQGLPLSTNSWHCGDGASGKGNRQTISIEICRDMYNTTNSDKWEGAKKNGALLTAILLNEYGWTIKDVYTHQMWTIKPKRCPHHILDEGWDKFLALVQKELDIIQGKDTKPQPVTSTKPQLYKVQVGAYKDKTNANKMADKLQAAGFATYVVEVNGLYKVQTGAFSKKENAEKEMKNVKAKGFDAFLVLPTVEQKPVEVKPVETKPTETQKPKEEEEVGKKYVKFVPRTILGNFMQTKWYDFAVKRTGVPLSNCFTFSTGRLSESLEKNVILDSKKRVVGAKQLWDDNYRNPDLIKVSSPQPGDLIIFGGTQYGHVANVEKVHSNGTISWSESHYGGAMFQYTTGNPATYYNYAGLTLLGYLRHKDWKDFDTNTNKPRKKTTSSSSTSAAKPSAAKTKNINGYEVILEDGTATITVDAINIRDGKPNGKVVGTYEKGESVRYFGKWIGNGHRYIVYYSSSGAVRFLAVSGTEKQGEDPWATFK